MLLAPAEAAVAAALTTRLGLVVPDVELLDALRPYVPTGNSTASLRAVISQVRTRLRGMHIVVRHGRGGYVLLVR